MKWLIFFGLLILLVAMVILRYRRQLQTALHVWRMFRQLKKNAAGGVKQSEKEIDRRSSDKNAPLVRCARCGKWVPQSEALNLRSKTAYCSANCMERAARIESLVDRD